MTNKEIAGMIGATEEKVKKDGQRGKFNRHNEESVAKYVAGISGNPDQGELPIDENAPGGPFVWDPDAVKLTAKEELSGFVPATGEVFPSETPEPAVEKKEVPPAEVPPEVSETPKRPMKPVKVGKNGPDGFVDIHTKSQDKGWLGSREHLDSLPVGSTHEGFGSFRVVIRLDAQGNREEKVFPRCVMFVPAGEVNHG